MLLLRPSPPTPTPTQKHTYIHAPPPPPTHLWLSYLFCRVYYPRPKDTNNLFTLNIHLLNKYLHTLNQHSHDFIKTVHTLLSFASNVCTQTKVTQKANTLMNTLNTTYLVKTCSNARKLVWCKRTSHFVCCKLTTAL